MFLLKPPSRRLAFALFMVPWLLVLSVPSLRLLFRVQALGSEYANEDYLVPITLAAVWIHPRQPTWKQSLKWAGASPASRHNIDLKAPRQLGDSGIENAEVARVCDAALERNPRNLWLIATHLRATLSSVKDVRAARDGGLVAPPQIKSVAAPPGSPFLAWNSIWDRMRDNRAEGDPFPVAGRGFYKHQIDYEYDSAIDAPRVSGKIVSLTRAQSLTLALQLARGGGSMESDNAYWPWQESYLLLLMNQDAAAWRALQRAVSAPRYDTHLRDDVQAALGVAQMHRPLLIEEKISIFARQYDGDKAFYNREKLWIFQSMMAEKAGDKKRAVEISAALAAVGAKMHRSAFRPRQLRIGLLLQSSAWKGWKRAPVRREGKTTATYGLSNLSFLYDAEFVKMKGFGTKKLCTPDLFARRFAQDARDVGRSDLADATLQQGKEAAQLARIATAGQREDAYFARAMPALLWISSLNWAAQSTLLQLQITAFFWLVLSLVFWRRLWFIGRYAARGWRLAGVLWRTRDKPLWDEDVTPLQQQPRDGARNTWAVAAVALPAAFGLSYWNIAANIWYRTLFDVDKIMVQIIISHITYFFAPVVVSLFWCGGVALRRYYRLKLPRVWRDDVEISALNAPPSIIPIATAFMTWSLTVFALFLWTLFGLTYWLRPKPLIFILPRLWSSFFNSGPIPIDWTTREPLLAMFFSFIALAAWVVKWVWQLHSRRRLPALYLGLKWWRETLGVWLIISSWLYLTLLIIALPARHQADDKFEQLLKSAALRVEK